jgi:hypothetical protein
VLYTIVGETFAAWVKEQVEIRNAKVKEEETIDLEASVAEAFFRSTAVSCKFTFSSTLTSHYFHRSARNQPPPHEAGQQAQTHQG